MAAAADRAGRGRLHHRHARLFAYQRERGLFGFREFIAAAYITW
jgi:hypothetical protein